MIEYEVSIDFEVVRLCFIVSLFGSVAAVQSAFSLKMHQNDVFYFKKIIFEISTSKRSSLLWFTKSCVSVAKLNLEIKCKQYQNKLIFNTWWKNVNFQMVLRWFAYGSLRVVFLWHNWISLQISSNPFFYATDMIKDSNKMKYIFIKELLEKKQKDMTHNLDWDMILESRNRSDRSVTQWKPSPRHQHY